MADPEPIEMFDTEPDIDYDEPALMPGDEAEALERADWHMRKASMLTRERDQLAAIYRAEIERLHLRLAYRTRIYDDQIEWHELPVESLHRALLRESPKRKTIELPHGTSKIRVSKTPRIEFTDKAATMAWAETAHPEILGRTINVTGVKSIASVTGALVIDDNGEVVPGVTAVLDEPSWSSLYDTGRTGSGS